ncbi:hypothetical protein GQ44DRAFT_722048 [Phaeosphaeriaceae sp. PMI808]|nr:hypothetical protein GQ44DRAFT_722048 [Phaeosphaeriaceae sp. PMI808]
MDKGATCEDISFSWGMTVEKLKQLNLDITCPYLDTKKSYGVIGTVNDNPAHDKLHNRDNQPRQPTNSRDCMCMWAMVNVCADVISGAATTRKKIQTPQPTQPDMISGCGKFYFVEKDMSCSQVLSAARVSLADLYQWNPSVNADYSNLWAEVSVCVSHVGGAETTPTRTASAGNSVETTQPPQPGMVINRKMFHLASKGNTCSWITSYENISLADFVE